MKRPAQCMYCEGYRNILKGIKTYIEADGGPKLLVEKSILMMVEEGLKGGGEE